MSFLKDTANYYATNFWNQTLNYYSNSSSNSLLLLIWMEKNIMIPLETSAIPVFSQRLSLTEMSLGYHLHAATLVCINCIFIISLDDSLFYIITHKFIYRRYLLGLMTFRSMKQSWTCTHTEKTLWGYFHSCQYSLIECEAHVNDPTPYFTTQNKK